MDETELEAAAFRRLATLLMMSLLEAAQFSCIREPHAPAANY